MDNFILIYKKENINEDCSLFSVKLTLSNEYLRNITYIKIPLETEIEYSFHDYMEGDEKNCYLTKGGNYSSFQIDNEEINQIDNEEIKIKKFLSDLDNLDLEDNTITYNYEHRLDHNDEKVREYFGMVGLKIVIEDYQTTIQNVTIPTSEDLINSIKSFFNYILTEPKLEFMRNYIPDYEL